MSLTAAAASAITFASASAPPLLTPLPPKLGVDEASRFLNLPEAAKYQCDLPRLDEWPGNSEFVESWQHRPFVLSAKALKLPSLSKNQLRDAQPRKAQARVVMDPEYGTLAQRRAMGYHDCMLTWALFIEYWALSKEKISEERARKTLGSCSPPRADGPMPRKRTLYMRADIQGLEEFLKPMMAQLPMYAWRGAERKELNTWTSTQGARTPMHSDTFWQVLVQIWGQKHVTVVPPNTSASLFAAFAQWPGLADRSQLHLLHGIDTQDSTADDIYSCLLHAGEALWLPPKWFHNVIVFWMMDDR